VTTLRASLCSGAIHIGVPAGIVVPAPRASSMTFAMPKSSSFTDQAPSRRFVRARKTFSGLRSRCTSGSSAVCAAPRPWQSSDTILRTSSNGSAPARSIACASVSPSSSSITSHGLPVSASTPAARTCTT
jgi:hypothetical protein